ncbi:hypothetical protein ACTFIY_008909 [Dictyostelium cf. discoideum]
MDMDNKLFINTLSKKIDLGNKWNSVGLSDNEPFLVVSFIGDSGSGKSTTIGLLTKNYNHPIPRNHQTLSLTSSDVNSFVGETMGSNQNYNYLIIDSEGNIVSTGTAFSPIKNFLEIDKNRDVGNNIYPIKALCGNSLCWVVYGAVSKQMSILPVNVIGLFITSYFIFIFISASSDLNKRHFLSAIYYVESIYTQDSIFGITSNVAVLIFYGSPVLSLVTLFPALLSNVHTITSEHKYHNFGYEY